MDRLHRDLKAAQDGVEGGELDATEVLKYDVGPLLVEFFHIWHDAQAWNASQVQLLRQGIGGAASAIGQLEGTVGSMQQLVDTLSQGQDDVSYETQFTAEDADALIRYTTAAMNYIAGSTGDEQIKTALLTKGQEIVQLVQENTLTVEEEDDDVG